MCRRELWELSARLGNGGFCPLERFIKGISESLHFDLPEPWEFFKSFGRGIGDVSEAPD